MTNKMPVVGQRYFSTRTGWECELKRFNEETATAYDKYGTRLECVATRFWDYFEEPPEDNLQETKEVPVVASKDFMEGYNAGWNDFGFKKDYRFKESTDNEPKGNKTPNPVDFEKGEVNKVERALEELKECIKNESTTKYRIIFEKAQNLVNALELESSKPITPEVGCGKKAYDEWIEACKKWKEEPETDIKEECVEPVSIWKDVSDLPEGLVDEGIVKWKRDFINSFEQMQKDIEELKKCKK